MSQANRACLQLPSKKAIRRAVVFWLQQSFFSANTWISFYLHFGAVQRIVMSANLSKPPFSRLFKEYIYIQDKDHSSPSPEPWQQPNPKSPVQVRRMCCANGILVNTWAWTRPAHRHHLVWEPAVCAVIFALCFQKLLGTSKMSQVGSSQQMSASAAPSPPQTQPQPFISAITKDASWFWCV